jgi:uncharacterized MnhB-related membrane protein
MRKANRKTGNGSLLLKAVIVLVLCAALMAIVLPASVAASHARGISAAGGLTPLMMKAPDTDVTSGDVKTPEAPRK